MRFEVPQFIEIEDKIIGPLTWRQFIYLAGGAGLLVILYFTLPFMIFVMLGLPLGGLAGSLAFHRVNNRPFSIFLESGFNYLTKTKLYLWRKSEPQTIIERSGGASLTEPHIAYANKRSIQSLSRKLEVHASEQT